MSYGTTNLLPKVRDRFLIFSLSKYINVKSILVLHQRPIKVIVKGRGTVNEVVFF